MNFDCIIANPPYSKIGCDITKNVIKQNPDINYAMLGTRSMFKPFYKDTLACQFVQIGKYELGSNVKLDWGVEQAILLATNGWTEVVDNRKKGGENMVGTPVAIERVAWNHRARNAYSVQINRSDAAGSAATHSRPATLVQMSQGQIPQEAYTRLRSVHLVGISIQTTSTANVINRDSFLTETDKDVPPSTCNGKRDYNLRSGYLYVSFETFEEACECAMDMISWTNPTDSHYRCVRWGFVQELVPHERFIEQ